MFLKPDGDLAAQLRGQAFQEHLFSLIAIEPGDLEQLVALGFEQRLQLLTLLVDELALFHQFLLAGFQGLLFFLQLSVFLIEQVLALFQALFLFAEFVAFSVGFAIERLLFFELLFFGLQLHILEQVFAGFFGLGSDFFNARLSTAQPRPILQAGQRIASRHGNDERDQRAKKIGHQFCRHTGYSFMSNPPSLSETTCGRLKATLRSRQQSKKMEKSPRTGQHMRIEITPSMVNCRSRDRNPPSTHSPDRNKLPTR